MTRDLHERVAPADSAPYAESLYRYAVAHLDPFSLRCWIIQRLMLDAGIEHQAAEEIFESVRRQAGRRRDASVAGPHTRRGSVVRRKRIGAFPDGAA